MKTLTDINVNGYTQDAIIEHFWTENRTPDNEIEWVNEKDSIAKCHGDARDVTILLKSTTDYSIISAIEIKATSVKKLYEKILEIEKQTSEQFID